MSEEQNCLTFSLTENVRFQKGQEVQELLSISLEPNVTCHEFDQYVILQGTLDCIGEYRPLQLEGDSEPDFYNVQKCARVTPNGDGETCTFCYSFPVDITIPADRCRDGEDLTVDIHSFEYKIQDEGCINVSCEFCVNGVYDRAFLEMEKAEQMESEQKQDEIMTDELRFDAVSPQYGYGQQDFQQPNPNQSNFYQNDNPVEYPQYQDFVSQNFENKDQNQPFEQTILDNTGYHPYYQHPMYGEQDWQQNTQFQWNEWNRSDTKNVQEQIVNPQQEYPVQEDILSSQQEYQMHQNVQNQQPDYHVPVQDYPVPPMEESEVEANYYQAQDFQQPFYQKNFHPWQPNQTVNTPKYSEPLVQPEHQQQSSVQTNEQPVQYEQVEKQQFGDITNFKLNVHGQREETGYKSIFHEELESPQGPAFDSVESPETPVKFENPETFEYESQEFAKYESPEPFAMGESPESLVNEESPSFEQPPTCEELEDVEVFSHVADMEEAESSEEVEVYREEDPLDVEQSYDQLIYPFESADVPTGENEFYVEVKREPFEYESDYESQQEVEESPEYVEFKRDSNTDNSSSSFVTDIFSSREERSTCLKIYIIQRGDSFEKLAQRYSIHPHKIARYNDLQPNAVLEEGSILYIPN